MGKTRAPRHQKRKRSIFGHSFDFEEDRNPLEVYLAAFGDDSQRTMRAALESVADILTDGKIKAPRLAWHSR